MAKEKKLELDNKPDEFHKAFLGAIIQEAFNELKQKNR